MSWERRYLQSIFLGFSPIVVIVVDIGMVLMKQLNILKNKHMQFILFILEQCCFLLSRLLFGSILSLKNERVEFSKLKLHM